MFKACPCWCACGVLFCLGLDLVPLDRQADRVNHRKVRGRISKNSRQEEERNVLGFCHLEMAHYFVVCLFL